MNKIFKVIFSKSLGRMVIVSENAKSAGKKNDKSFSNGEKIHTRISLSQSNIKTISCLLILLGGIISPIALAGSFALSPTSTAVGADSGDSYAWNRVFGADSTLEAISGIPVKATGTSVTTVTHVNEVSLTPAQKTAFISAIQNGGNIAIGERSSAVGIRNVSMGGDSSALGNNNNAAAYLSSAIGYRNAATGTSSVAMGAGLALWIDGVTMAPAFVNGMEVEATNSNISSINKI